jgi:hypothetical protein
MGRKGPSQGTPFTPARDIGCDLLVEYCAHRPKGDAMSYPKFTRIRLLADNTIKVQGTTGVIDGADLIEDVTAIDVAIVCLKDPDRRLETSLRRNVGDKVVEPWHCRPVLNQIDGFPPFTPNEVVVLVGSATHQHAGLTSPFLWDGFFKIQSLNDPDDGEVTLVAST